MYKTRKSRRNFANNKDFAPLSFPHLDLVPAFVPDMIEYINASPSVFKQKFTLGWVEKAQKIPLNILSNPLENSDHDSNSPSDVEDLATTGDQDSLPDSVDHAPPLNTTVINTVPRKYPPFKPLLTNANDQDQDENFQGLSPIHYDPNVRRGIIYDAKQGEHPERNQYQYKMADEEVQNDDTDDDENDKDDNDDDEYSNDAHNWRKKRRKRKQHHHHHQGRKLRLPTPSPSRSNLSPPPIPKKILQNQEVKRTAFPQLHKSLKSLKRRQTSKNKTKNNKSENLNNRNTNFVHKMKSFVVQHIQRNSSTIIEPTITQIQTKPKKRTMGKKTSLKNEEDLNITQQKLKNNRKSIRSIKGQQQQSKMIPFNNNNKNRIDLPTRFKGKFYYNGQTTTTTTTINNNNLKNAFMAAITDPDDFEPTVTNNKTGDDDDDDDNLAKTMTKKQEKNEDPNDLKGDAVSSRKIGVKIKKSIKKKVKRPAPPFTLQTNSSPPWKTTWGPINKQEEAIVNTFLEKRMKKKKKVDVVKKKRVRIPRNKIFPEEDFLDDDEEPDQNKFQNEFASSVKEKLSKILLKEDKRIIFFGGEKDIIPIDNTHKNNNVISDLDSKSSPSSFTSSPHQRFSSKKRRSNSRSRNKKSKRMDSLTMQPLQRPTPSFYHGIQVHNLFHRDLDSEVSSKSVLIEKKELLLIRNQEDPLIKKEYGETPEQILNDNNPNKKLELEAQKRPKEQQQNFQPSLKKEMAKSTRKKGMKRYQGKLPENPRLLLQLLQNKSIKNPNRIQNRKMQMQNTMGHINDNERGMDLKHLHLQGGEGTPGDPGSGVNKDKISDAEALLISQGVGSELYSPFEQLPSPPNDLVRPSGQASPAKVQNTLQDINKKEQNLPEKDIILDFMKGQRDHGSDISSSFPFPVRESDYVQRLKPSLSRNPRLKWNNKPKPLHLYFESKIMPNNKRNYKNIHTLVPLNRREQILKYEFEDNESIILTQRQEFQFNFSKPEDFDSKHEKTKENYNEKENQNLSAYRLKLSDTSNSMMKIRSHPNLKSVTRATGDDEDVDDEGQFLLLHPKPPFNSKEQLPIFNNNAKNNNNNRPRGRVFPSSRKMRSKKTRVRQN